ncbi:PIG-L deacetylase family protein [Dapis sp. BLCC M172]|uniref:PIG-L deacetylase family protein n=1 Tax=Dapis sp. BLCC M172 TaxID=2975281 RepID=UPI003CEF38B7
MTKPLIKNKVSQFYKRILKHNCREYNETDLKKSALIFSPHFDDETLGCGGLIIKKKQVGADVKLVFMTDGSKSHNHLMSGKKLQEIRKQESFTVAELLGLIQDDITLLDFPETQLNENYDSAVQEVTKIINKYQPEEIFIPHFREPLLWSADHLTTTKIVKAALKLYQKDAIVYEYPVWFWFHWPWVSLPIKTKQNRKTILKNTLIYWFGLRVLGNCNCSLYIGDILTKKRAALEQYKSQMTRLINNPKWATLQDISNGEFLECFFQENETFRQYSKLK